MHENLNSLEYGGSYWRNKVPGTFLMFQHTLYLWGSEVKVWHFSVNFDARSPEIEGLLGNKKCTRGFISSMWPRIFKAVQIFIHLGQNPIYWTPYFDKNWCFRICYSILRLKLSPWHTFYFEKPSLSKINPNELRSKGVTHPLVFFIGIFCGRL